MKINPGTLPNEASSMDTAELFQGVDRYTWICVLFADLCRDAFVPLMSSVPLVSSNTMFSHVLAVGVARV